MTSSYFALQREVCAWRCIGYGRIEGRALPGGVCEDRTVEPRDIWDYAEGPSDLEGAGERVAALEAVVTQPARTRPREGA